MAHFNWQQPNTLILHCHIQPKAKHNEIVGLYDGALKIRLQAPPVDGQANRCLVEFLSAVFAVPKRQIKLARGQTSRRKTLIITGPKDLPPECLIASNNVS